MDHKILGLCAAKIHEDECYRRIDEIEKAAEKRGYKLLVFDPEVIMEMEKDFEARNLLFMMNPDKLAGLIIDAEHIADERVVSALRDKAKEKNIPFVSFNIPLEGTVSVISNPENTFRELLNHLSSVHGCKTFDYVGSVKDSMRCSILLKVFHEEMEKMGNAVAEERIVHGEFDDEDMLEKVRCNLDKAIPDAIVCTCDRIAIKVCYELKKRGLRVPEDVIVTGMRGCARGKLHTPLLTTGQKDMQGMAERAIESIEAMNRNETPDMLQMVDGSLRLAQSCGCTFEDNRDTTELVRDLYDVIDLREKLDNHLYRMEAALLKSKDFRDSGMVLREFLIDDVVVCCRKAYMDDIFYEGDVQGTEEHKECMIALTDTRAGKKDQVEFVMEDLVPDLAEELEKHSSMVLIPLRYEKNNFGYIVFCLKDYSKYVYYIEKYGSKLNSVLGKYINDQKIRFANKELLRAYENMEQMQVRDGLTGLYNSRGFLRELEGIKKNCLHEKKKMVLLCVDLDRLGHINDIHGHSEGDIAIQTLARMVQDSVSDTNITGRLGSDEIAIAIKVDRNVEFEVNRVLKTLESRIQSYNEISGKDYKLEINYGHYALEMTKETVMKEALDEALSKKRSAKNNRRASLSADNGASAPEIDEEERRKVSDVIANNAFKYAFQPIVSAKTGEIYAYEALMRTDTEPSISPLAVLKYATMDQKLYDIERATLNNVFAIVDKNRETLKGKKVFINSIPGYHLDDTDYGKLEHQFGEIFKEVVIEITEQNQMQDDGIDLLKYRSANSGFEVAIDDFGTGYSNTASLLQFLPNYVKIDRMLIAGINEDSKRQHFVKNIIEFAHDNGFMALAEGVETAEELYTMIQMDVDLIQGFYTAKPSFEIQMLIPQSIKREIIGANVKGKDKSKKKMYVVNQEEEIILMRLALEQYTGIVVAQPELTIIGNPDFDADMMIRIKEDSKCRLTIRNVRLTGRDEIPCIEVGRNAELTLVIEETNGLDVTGIRVSQDSKLILEGGGDLKITTKGFDGYGIGNDPGSHFGTIISKMSGGLFISTEGNKCIGIGGGYACDNSRIEIHGGKVEVNVASVDGCGIGSMEGECPIVLDNAGIFVDTKIANGCGIGNLDGRQNLHISNASVRVTGSGNDVCGIGTILESDGEIDIQNARIDVIMNGYRVKLLGNAGGGLNLFSQHSRIEVKGEGIEVLGIGATNMDATLRTKHVTFEVTINSGMPIALGAEDTQMFFEGGMRILNVNAN